MYSYITRAGSGAPQFCLPDGHVSGVHTTSPQTLHPLACPNRMFFLSWMDISILPERRSSFFVFLSPRTPGEIDFTPERAITSNLLLYAAACLLVSAVAVDKVNLP